MAHKRKIFTVLLLAGCGTTSAPSSQTAAPAVANLPVPVTAPHGATAPAATEPAMPAEPPAPRADDQLPQAILDLRVELYRGGRDLAASQPQRFRALCDREGYPLVGNIANKGARYSVEEYCGDVRGKLGPSS